MKQVMPMVTIYEDIYILHFKAFIKEDFTLCPEQNYMK